MDKFVINAVNELVKSALNKKKEFLSIQDIKLGTDRVLKSNI